MIKFHPSEEILQQFAVGDLSPALSVVVATHVDMCSHCAKQVQEIEHLMAEKFSQTAKGIGSSQMDTMLEQIFASNEPAYQVIQDTDNIISLEGKRFKLPATLARQKDRIGPWSKVPGKLYRAPVNLGSGECMNLIYMDEGSSVPEHTHKGQEATLVINGVFHDESGEYRDGDFILMNSHDQHAPQTQNEDCLTLAVLDAPMHFTSGISRLLNPFSSLFFR
ncbi:MAG: cupin domain-containing protein [Idiomarina sp.]|nr:cupin domain-containing protein [Idiomarina sp.]